MKIFLQFLAMAMWAFIADYLWLGVIMQGVYHDELRELLRRDTLGFAPRLLPAALVYILIPMGVILFVGPRIASTRSLFAAAGWGAVFGFIVYGIYDLTNLAILEKWSVLITVVDILWGCILCAGAAVCVALVDRIIAPVISAAE